MKVENLNEELRLSGELQESQAVKHGAKHPKHQFNWLPVLSAIGVCFIGNHKHVLNSRQEISQNKSYLSATGPSAPVV